MIDILKKTPLEKKSTNNDIKYRFDNDVERFSNLETGQRSMIDADIMMDLITTAAVTCNPNAKKVLDIGCGAGNNTLKLLQLKNPLDCDLIDLSLPMLTKAKERISIVNNGKTKIYQGDIRSVKFPENYYDIIIGAAVFHHLRENSDWEKTFTKIYNITAPGGILLVTDVITQEHNAINDMMWEKVAEHLDEIGGKEYSKKVFEYIDKEDSPRSVTFQIDVLKNVGFKYVDVLHKKTCSAAIAAIKA
jgi:tRNA (cmo5U34)-methyltransferase